MCFCQMLTWVENRIPQFLRNVKNSSCNACFPLTSFPTLIYLPNLQLVTFNLTAIISSGGTKSNYMMGENDGSITVI